MCGLSNFPRRSVPQTPILFKGELHILFIILDA